MRLEARPRRDGAPRITCQIDAWLRGRGVVTVRHTDTNAYAAVDRAVVRLRRAIARDVGPAGRLRRLSGSMHEQGQPEHAIAVVPHGRGPWRDAWRWLRWRYGIQHLHTIRLSGVEWDGLASEAEGGLAAERLKDRLALSLLGRPELIAVIGNAPVDPAWREWSRSPKDVQRIAERIAAWDLPVHVVGVWMDGPAEVQQLTAHSVPSDVRIAASAAGPEDDDQQWLAEQTWETEGGRPLPADAPATQDTERKSPGRQDENAWQFQHAATERPDAWDAQADAEPARGLPGFRPDPPRLAHA